MNTAASLLSFKTKQSLCGRRVYQSTRLGESVPFRAIDQQSTPNCFGRRANPTFYTNDVTGHFFDNTPIVKRDRPLPGSQTQLHSARAGIITPEMAYVAVRENRMRDVFAQEVHALRDEKLERFLKSYLDAPFVTEDFVREEVACGRAVIPMNFCHPEAQPMIIGKHFHTKVNANIGASDSAKSDIFSEVEKLKTALWAGADTVMDLSIGKDILAIRQQLLRTCPVPLGTVPIYEALERVNGQIESLSWDVFRETMLGQAKEGVDYMTIHAGVLHDHVLLTKNRLTGIVSRGGGLLASWMMKKSKENFLYTHFDELLDIALRYDITLSLGDGLRAGSLFDGNDAAQMAELKTLGELASRAYEAGVQVMIEGPGHIPYQKIQVNQTFEDSWCKEAPFYTLGPLVSDIGAGYDHITAAIGATVIGAAGTSMLCCVTPKEHLGLPDANDVREGMVAFKIAAHAADIAKGIAGAPIRDVLMSLARFEFRWNDQYQLALDSEKARLGKAQTLSGQGANETHFCSMCGPKYCPMRVARELFK